MIMPKRAIKIRDRRLEMEVEEKIPAGQFLSYLYQPAVYPWLGKLLYSRPFFSRWLGKLARSRWSRWRIARFVREHDIDLSECLEERTDWQSFNDFFIRRLNSQSRPWDERQDRLACPADCRALFTAALDSEARLPVKGVDFKVEELLGGDKEQGKEFISGPAMIARLAPVDCHRFHFPASGQVAAQWFVPGGYDSVHPLALRRRRGILTGNCRRITVLDLDHWGRAAMVEVGAFAVADIVQTYREKRFRKMDEKGYFNLGGSTIVLLLNPGSVVWDADLLESSARGIETKLRFGERIGVRPRQRKI